MHDSLSKARRWLIANGIRGSSSQYELAPSQKHCSNLGTALRQKVIHLHECAQTMQLQVEKLQADMERIEKFVSEAWEALRAPDDKRHSEAPHRHVEEAVSAALRWS